ncbi:MULTISPECIES: thiamine diphosphokinase [Exiguobacterium]|uniref:thiamine diphosphokinase n=1 Tax=Exiguobacterium TaxID=33986 RepID=UPI001BEB8E71|nr:MULTISPECIES: thiamine diphosphokinase [Exiguobacterium]MCT4782759.1 thiamine diphosphokinase [Exiguobacterium himgiriensis]
MRVLIVAASPTPIPPLPKDVDYVIAVDGGYATLLAQGINADLVVGDFDSFTGVVPDEALRYPSEKDVTDLEIALEAARRHGADEMLVYGALGGRLDMTLGNIGLLEAYPEMRLFADGQLVYLARTGLHRLTRQDDHYLSLIPWKQANVSIHGVKYPLDRHDVVSHEALTISNEWDAETAELVVHDGMVLVLYVKK